MRWAGKEEVEEAEKEEGAAGVGRRA